MKINTLVLGLALMSGAAFAQSSGTQDQSQSQMGNHHHGDGKQDMQQHIDKVSAELNLSADQKTQVQGIMNDQMSQARSVRQDSSLSADQKEAKLKELHESTHSKINAVLTPDQQKKFAEMRKEMKEEHKEHKHRGGDKDNTSKQ